MRTISGSSGLNSRLNLKVTDCKLSLNIFWFNSPCVPNFLWIPQRHEVILIPLVVMTDIWVFEVQLAARGHCVGRSLCGKVTVWGGHCMGRSLCGEVTVWEGHWVGRCDALNGQSRGLEPMHFWKVSPPIVKSTFQTFLKESMIF